MAATKGMGKVGRKSMLFKISIFVIQTIYFVLQLSISTNNSISEQINMMPIIDTYTSSIKQPNRVST